MTEKRVVEEGTFWQRRDTSRRAKVTYSNRLRPQVIGGQLFEDHGTHIRYVYIDGTGRPVEMSVDKFLKTFKESK